MTTADLFAPKPARVFRFLWISKQGPKLRIFDSVQAFSSYVHEVRQLAGFSVVEFRTPFLAVGLLP